MLKKNRMGLVICKLPKAGLGNQLFPLMRAYTFAHLNHLPVLVYNYHQLKIGPRLRGEKSKRNYKDFFNFEKNIFAAQWDRLKVLKINKGELIFEPEIRRMDKKIPDCSFFFNCLPHYEHHFDGLQENRELVLKIFWELVSPKIIKKLNELDVPRIGVHIRMGDFKKPGEDVAFGTVGQTRSPQEYFINMINSIREIHGTSLPVTIFTDGKKSELEQLFLLENIFLSEGNNDLTDLLLLSKSDIIVNSAGSTFSSWAGFISNAILFVHPAYEGLRIRSLENNNEVYEGKMDITDEKLVSKIKSLVS